MTSSCKIANVVSELWTFPKLVGVDFKKKAAAIFQSYASSTYVPDPLLLTFGYEEWDSHRTDIISDPKAALL
jgi:hypothetical protein